MTTTQDFGTVEQDGKTLTLTQQAFVGGPTDRPYYEAAWPGDESECCDWSKFEVREA